MVHQKPEGVNIMKRTLLFCILIAFFTISFVSLVGCNQSPKEQPPVSLSNQDNDRKVDYQLQESCGKSSRELFTERYGNGLLQIDNQNIIVSYKNHYNKKLNKCFILLKSETVVKREIIQTLITLGDLNENKEYGRFQFTKENQFVGCVLLEKECKSESEWDLLVKPYMEE